MQYEPYFYTCSIYSSQSKSLFIYSWSVLVDYIPYTLYMYIIVVSWGSQLCNIIIIVHGFINVLFYHVLNIIYYQGHLYVPVRPRPANKLCPLNFSISTCINFHLKNQKKSLQHVNIINVELRYFIFQSVIKNVLQKICFLQILRPLRLWRPKAMALLA